MAFIILYAHLQLGHSVPSSMWMTQPNPEDEPFSVFRGIPPFSLTPSPRVILSSVSGYFCPRPCSQPLVFSIQLIFCLPLLSHPLASDTKASCTFPISSSWCCPCLDHTSGCIFCFLSLLTLASVSAKPHPSFGIPDPALESPSFLGLRSLHGL